MLFIEPVSHASTARSVPRHRAGINNHHRTWLTPIVQYLLSKAVCIKQSLLYFLCLLGILEFHPLSTQSVSYLPPKTLSLSVLAGFASSRGAGSMHSLCCTRHTLCQAPFGRLLQERAHAHTPSVTVLFNQKARVRHFVQSRISEEL